jgi:hypothetical protein
MLTPVEVLQYLICFNQGTVPTQSPHDPITLCCSNNTLKYILFTTITCINFKQVLCKSYPLEFTSYFHYCRSLRFEDKPDYSFFKKLFRDLFILEGIAKHLSISFGRSLCLCLFCYITFLVTCRVST